MAPRPSSALLLCLGAACGGRDAAVDSAAGGSGQFYVQSNVPTAGSSAGASYERSATFTPGCNASSPAVGPCNLNLCFAPSAADAGSPPVPDAGPITIGGAQMVPLALQPQDSGAYTPSIVEGQLPWTTGGEPVTFAWASLPGNPAAPGGSITLATPPYIALAAGSAFAVATSTLVRSQDLTVSWTSDSPPSSADQVAVDLDSGSTQLVCIFSASAGTGVIPAAALQLVAPGSGSYNVHSKEAGTLKGVDGTPWRLGFNVDAQARASDGLAKGSITFQ